MISFNSLCNKNVTILNNPNNKEILQHNSYRGIIFSYSYFSAPCLYQETGEMQDRGGKFLCPLLVPKSKNLIIVSDSRETL